MSWLAWLLVAGALAAPDATLVTLDGAEHRGRLEQVSAERIVLASDAGETAVPLSEVASVRFDGETPAESESAADVVLVDGSRLAASRSRFETRKLECESPLVGKISLPADHVASLRFAPLDEKIEAAWRELAAKERKRDLLIVRKQDKLDHFDGIVAGMNDKAVQFVVDGEEVSVARTKVFGLLLGGRKPVKGDASCEVSLRGQGRLRAAAIEKDGESIRARLLSGDEITLPLAAVAVLDFSLGNVRYLSQMEPRRVDYVPYFDVTWKYRRDRNLEGGPLRVGEKEFARGLCVHSRTLLVYRLNQEFARFQTVVGIDRSMTQGDVHLVISGDGKSLLEQDVRSGDPPLPVDLDVSSVRDLEILVDFGGNHDISDHLDLADAKVIK